MADTSRWDAGAHIQPAGGYVNLLPRINPCYKTDFCISCKNPFKERTKGFIRHDINNYVSLYTFSKVFSHVDVKTLQHYYICETCLQILYSRTVESCSQTKRQLPTDLVDSNMMYVGMMPAISNHDKRVNSTGPFNSVIEQPQSTRTLGDKCVTCCRPFEESDRMSSRFDVMKYVSPLTFCKIFPHVKDDSLNSSYICAKCFTLMMSKTVPATSTGLMRSLPPQGNTVRDATIVTSHSTSSQYSSDSIGHTSNSFSPQSVSHCRPIELTVKNERSDCAAISNTAEKGKQKLCVSCQKPFQKQGNFLNCVDASVVVHSADTFNKIFPHISYHSLPHHFVCHKCFDIMKSKTVVTKAGKRRLSRSLSQTDIPSSQSLNKSVSSSNQSLLSTAAVGNETGTAAAIKEESHIEKDEEKDSSNLATQTKRRRLSRSHSDSSEIEEASSSPEAIDQVCKFLKKGHYKAALRLLVRQAPAAKDAVVHVAADMIRTERQNALKIKTLQSPVDARGLKSFNWSKVLEEVGEHQPTTLQCVRAMFPSATSISMNKIPGLKNDKRMQTVEEAEETLQMRIGVTLAIGLYTLNPKKFMFFQSCMGMKLWLEGCSLSLFPAFGQFGLSQDPKAITRSIDSLRSYHDVTISRWKKIVENCWQTNKRGSDIKEKPGYALCWNSTQAAIHHKNQFSTSTSSQMFGVCFATSHRVPTLHLTSPDVSDALSIDSAHFLPQSEEFLTFRLHMTIMVERILVNNIPALESFKPLVTQHIRHINSDRMTHKTHTVNLGVVKTDAGTIDGWSSIMRHLFQYLPQHNGVAVPCLCSSDNVDPTKIVHLHCSKMSALVAAPQEYRKEVVLLQDLMDDMYKDISGTARGTITEMKTTFRHTLLKRCIMSYDIKQLSNVQSAWHMVEVMTESYVTLCAMTRLGMNRINGIIMGLPHNKSDEDKKRWLHAVASAIIDFCWCSPARQDIHKVMGAMKYPETPQVLGYCDCMQDKDEPLVRCFNSKCRVEKKHLSCAGLTALPAADAEFFCSPECEEDDGFIYCYCHERLGGDMVQCARKENCSANEWYHLPCLNMSHLDEASGTWYCCDECEDGSVDEDSVLNHTKWLMWCGLSQLVRRDAVREGNGPVMLSHWKMDLINFWQHGRHQEVATAHKLLADVGGLQPKHICEDLIWNRVANLGGTPAGNIGLDMVGHILNKSFKELLNQRNIHNHRDLDNHVARSAQMAGSLFQWINENLLNSATIPMDVDSVGKSPQDMEDIANFTSEYQKDALFNYIPGRCHKGFEGFQVPRRIHNPEELGRRLRCLSEGIDSLRQVLGEADSAPTNTVTTSTVYMEDTELNSTSSSEIKQEVLDDGVDGILSAIRDATDIVNNSGLAITDDSPFTEEKSAIGVFSTADCIERSTGPYQVVRTETKEIMPDVTNNGKISGCNVSENNDISGIPCINTGDAVVASDALVEFDVKSVETSQLCNGNGISESYDDSSDATLDEFDAVQDDADILGDGSDILRDGPDNDG